MLKEIIIFDEGRDDIENITIGIFPAKGRYYRKNMSKNDSGFFHVEVDLPHGISYYHLYLNNDFLKEYIDINTSIANHDLKSRVPIVLKSDIFNHIFFKNEDRFISYVHKDLIEVKLISYYSWINRIILVDEKLQEFDFHVSFKNENKKYWHIRYKKGDAKKFAIKFGDRDRMYWLIENNKATSNIEESTFFEFPEFSQNQSEINISGAGYQIFPDRFCKSKKQTENKIFYTWGSQPDTYTYFGGDIQGILDKLPIIKRLGVKFIYLNPVFFSKSAHRYDTINYRKIDPIIGTNADFRKLVDKIHSLGLKIIVDISINHCSTDFIPFKHLLKYNEKSKYKDWFIIYNFPVSINCENYSCWQGYKELPQFNFNNLEVQDYLIESALYWLKKYDIDGWRVDVSDEIPDQFLYKFIKANRRIKRDILLIGENLHNDSTDFVCNNGGDGITAYGLYQEVFMLYFVEKKINLNGLAENLVDYIYTHSFNALRKSWVFLSNHDLPRFCSLINDDADFYLAFCLLYAIPGTPILFFGEEIMLNDHPGYNRCSMNWDNYKLDHPSFSFFKKMNEIRNQFKDIFDNGDFNISYLDCKKNLFIISRKYMNNEICFILNFSEEELNFNLDSIINQGKKYRLLFGNPINNNHIKLIRKKANLILIYH